jgi:hypothetical protein
MSQTHWPFEPAVRDVLRQLARGDFATLAASGRCSAADLQRAVSDYGRTILVPPRDEELSLEVVQIETSASAAWSVVVDLRTLEEGRSDLAIELTVHEQAGGFVVEVHDLHVL